MCAGNTQITHVGSERVLHASRFGFVKYKTKQAATAALAKLGGRELADFPGQTVRAALASRQLVFYDIRLPATAPPIQALMKSVCHLPSL